MKFQAPLSTPGKAICLAIMTARQTLGESMEIARVQTNLTFAALGLSWSGAAPWPSLEASELDLQRFGEGVLKALLSWQIEPGELGRVAALCAENVKRVAADSVVLPFDSAPPQAAAQQPAKAWELPEPKPTDGAELRMAYLEALRATRAYKALQGG